MAFRVAKREVYAAGLAGREQGRFRGCGWVAKRWSVEGMRRWRGGRVGGLYDGIDFYVCEKYKMMDINLPRLAAILHLFLLHRHHPSYPLRYSLFFAAALSRISLSRSSSAPFLPFSNAFTIVHPLTNRTYTVYPVHSDVDLRESTPLCVRVYRVCRL